MEEECHVNSHDIPVKHQAERFIESYYEIFDSKKYECIENLYTKNAFLTYNGKQVQGRDDIVFFWMNLPEATHHDCSFQVYTLTDNYLTFAVQAEGRVQYKYRKLLAFKQTFTLTKMTENNEWKIITDRCETSEIEESDL